MSSLITPQIDNTIKELVEELGHNSHFCEMICEKVNEQYATNFTLNQVRQHLKDELQVKIPQNRGEPFTKEIDNSIKESMEKFAQSSNPYVKVSDNINKLYDTNYTSKQIRQREVEKSFIVQWVESKPQGDTIPWKELIPLMETKFEKLRSENMVKNFWNLRKRTQASTESKSETDNSRKRKRSPKLKEKSEKQQKKVCHELTTFEYENEKYIKSSPPNGDSNARPMDTSPKSEENIIHSPPLNAISMETSFKSEERIYLPSLNARPMEISFKSEPLNASSMETSFKSEPLNARSMETSFKSEERIYLPSLNARPMEISFKSEPLNASSMETSFKSEPLNARSMETSFKSEPLNARLMEITFKSEESIHLSPLNANSMKISFKSEPLNASPMKITFLNTRPIEISFKNEP
ncbi:2370_t:CDS:2 [Rhizophagus irregularis]|nr:2370_t:CDS:2 [Rhizophagus irregularis]